MTATTDARIAMMDDLTALPRKNGELVFNAPWEGRIFGLAVALNDAGAFEWDAFRDRLKASIATTESAGKSIDYYELWLQSFESLLVDRGLVTRDELDRQTEACAAEDEEAEHHHEHEHQH
ncbi:MAG TPA: nitrile hydratase accessory protein [Chloroflexota bacterium]|nr:nitrile hydratase accessory protein [Chloroflexota bacterium]